MVLILPDTHGGKFNQHTHSRSALLTVHDASNSGFTLCFSWED